MMKIGLGLPAAVPEVDATTIGDWAAAAEHAGFASVGVIDRLVYDNLEPLVALAAAAARTQRVELFTTVLNVGWRANPVLLAKQLASVDLLSGGRLTAGLGLGGWPEDYEASDVPISGRGARLDATLATLRRAWAGELAGQGGPMRQLADGRPALLFGGLVPAAWTRAATLGQGWVAPLMGRQMLEDGAAAVRRAWADAGRAGNPRIITGRYFCLGLDADTVADHYIRHYYGDEGFPTARADTLTTADQVRAELDRLAAAGVTDVVLYPSSANLDQIELLADIVLKYGKEHIMGATSGNPTAAGPSADLQALERLVGTWTVSGGAEGTTTYEWMEGGFFLLQRFDLEHQGHRVVGIEVIGHERPFGGEPGVDIATRAYDNEGNTLDYVYELDGDVLTIWGGEKGSPAYYRGTFSPDGNSLTGGWVYPGGGGYQTTMTRIPAQRIPTERTSR